MQDLETFQAALGLKEPWFVAKSRFSTGHADKGAASARRSGAASAGRRPTRCDGTMMMRGGDEGLKGCAARTGKPDSALDPRTATPRLADMPFRGGGSTAVGSVISNVPWPIAGVGGFRRGVCICGR